jgi:hypothetical protein
MPSDPVRCTIRGRAPGLVIGQSGSIYCSSTGTEGTQSATSISIPILIESVPSSDSHRIFIESLHQFSLNLYTTVPQVMQYGICTVLYPSVLYMQYQITNIDKDIKRVH